MALGAILTVLFLFQLLYLVLPKAEESKVERRKLASFPALSIKSFADGSWHRGVETYLSDHLPLRQVFIRLDRSLKSVLELKFLAQVDEEQVEIVRGEREVYDQGNQMTAPGKSAEESSAAPEIKASEATTTPPSEKVLKPEPAKPNRDNLEGEIAFESYAVIIKGTQGMEIFNYAPELWSQYTARLNYLRGQLPPEKRMFSMVVPTAVAFYGPQTYREKNYSTFDAIQQAYSELDQKIFKCDAYGYLSQHTDEYIYFRTDHHWTGLGAYYGYQSFCEQAGYTPTPLDQMMTSKSDTFLGTLYANSEQNPVLANNPDYCVYYRPLHVGVSLASESADLSNTFYCSLLSPDDFPDYPYLGYSGGDVAVVQIKTEHKPALNRKIVILKDSYGNALVPLLMDHYDEIYVIDPRPFRGNLLQFINEHQIDDVLIINYTFASSNPYWLEGFDLMTGYQGQ